MAQAPRPHTHPDYELRLAAIEGMLQEHDERIAKLEALAPIPTPDPVPDPIPIPDGDPRKNATIVTGHDTAAIVAAIEKVQASPPTWNGYRVVYFPAGVYQSANPEFTGLGNILFIGDGFDSVWQHPNTNMPPATFIRCGNLAMRSMAFDSNGVTAFSAMRFYGCHTVRIDNTRWFDSHPLGQGQAGGNDRGAVGFYSIGNANPDDVNSDIYFGHNLIEDLEADFCNLKGAVIEYNISKRCPSTAAIGCFANNDGDVIEDVIIRNNTIIDPYRAAICCNKDVASVFNTRFKNIEIHHNQISWKTFNGTSILLGTANILNDQPTDLFEDFTVVDNIFEYDPACPFPDSETSVLAFLAPGFDPSFRLVRGEISRNELRGGGKAAGTWAFNLRGLKDSKVEDNIILDCGNGLSVSGRIENTSVLRNTVRSGGYAYGFNNTWGGNSFGGNKYLVPPEPSLIFDKGNIAASDRVIDPIPA
jgi:hypothetical protein